VIKEIIDEEDEGEGEEEEIIEDQELRRMREEPEFYEDTLDY